MSDLPAADIPPLRGGPILRWGIVGPGGIADDFVAAVRRHTDQRVVAVASRSAERARRHAERYGAERSFDSVQALVDDPGVDVVYVATPHTAHLDAALAAVRAGKAVLVEKPITVSAAEAERLRAAASAAGVLVMEAMWTRYLPQSDVIRRTIDRGDLGRIRLVTADVGWRADLAAVPRLADPSLGGGAVLDMGVYAYWFVRFAAGAIRSVRAAGTLAGSGVDEQAVAAFTTSSGAIASTSVTMAVENSGLAAVRGTGGAIRFLDPFVFPARFVLSRGGDERVWADGSGIVGRDGLAWQATALARYVAEGRTDSPVHGWDDAIATMRVMDEVRAQIG